jgi:hypothetical protein
MNAYNVRLNGKLIDTVFYTPSKGETVKEAEDTTRRSLIEHDGYDGGIVVRQARKRTARKTHQPIPADFPVQPVRAGQSAADAVTCGHCGLTWDDAIVTGMTPAPSARCPFEYFHIYPKGGK